MRRILIPAVIGLATLGAAACSPDEGDFKSEAEDFITDEEGDVAEQTGMTFADAECQEPASTEAGSTFTCTATGSDDVSYTFTASIVGDSEFSIDGVDPLPGTVDAATATTAAG